MQQGEDKQTTKLHLQEQVLSLSLSVCRLVVVEEDKKRDGVRIAGGKIGRGIGWGAPVEEGFAMHHAGTHWLL